MKKFSGTIEHCPRFSGVINRVRKFTGVFVDCVVNDDPVIPDVPIASMYLYGQQSETGNIGLRVGETVTLYNGAVLPKLPEWDKETYPYAILKTQWNIDDGSFKLAYLFLYTNEANYHVTDNGWVYFGSTPYKIHHVVGSDSYIEGSTDAWSDGNEYDKDGSTRVEEWNVRDIYMEYLTWANFKVEYDGTVYLEASDPIPVSGIVGYSYNGTVLSELPESELPYSLVHKSESANDYYFIASERAGEVYNTIMPSNLRIEIGSESTTHRWKTWKLSEGTTEWVEHRGSDTVYYENFKANTLIWTNCDMYYKDSTTVTEDLRGTLYVSASSDPILVYE